MQRIRTSWLVALGAVLLSSRGLADLTVAGTLRTPGGGTLAGSAVVRASNGGGSATSSGGAFSLTVANGWSGVFVVEYTENGQTAAFTPSYRAYTNLAANQTVQDFTLLGSSPPPVGGNNFRTIGGCVTNAAGQGVSDVLLTASDGGGAALTASDGTYALGYYFSSGTWSGTVTPRKEGSEFSPETRTYAAISASQSGQNYCAAGGGAKEVETVSATASDYEPAVGAGTNSPIQQYRLLLATSTNGYDWVRTRRVLADQSSVADAAVLSDGRLLVYFVSGGVRTNGVTQTVNEIKLAVSDDGGETWLYRTPVFLPEMASATKPVDPNVVVTTNGTLRMLVTVDPDQGGSANPCSYSATSTDGGVAYTLHTNAPAFQVAGTDLLDPENFAFGPANWRIWTGGVPGKNLTGVSTNGGFTFENQGEFCSSVNPDDTNKWLIVSDILADGDNRWRMYVFSDTATDKNIRCLTSTNASEWTLVSNFVFRVDTSDGAVEATDVWAPTVVRLADGTYRMVYETRIPADASTDLGAITVSASALALATGQTARVTALATAEDGTLRDVSMLSAWLSSSGSVASVSACGVVTGLTAGVTGVRLACGGVTSAPLSLLVFDAASRAARGTPMAWLARHYPHTNDFDAAELDDGDGDGYAAWQEYVADTDPTNAASVFAITAVSNGPPVGVAFASSAQRYYTLEWCADLALGVWSNVADQVGVQGGGGLDALRDASSASRRFYRVRVDTEP